MKKKIIILIFLFLYNLNCHAEGQDGLNSIFNSAHIILYCTCIFVYTMIGSIVIKLILKKFNLFAQRQTIIAFLTSLIITISAVGSFGDDFTFYIWNHL